MESNKKNLAICVVADFKYLHKNFDRFFNQLVNNGKYFGDVLIITTKFCPTFLIKSIRKNKNVSVLKFKKINFSNKASNSLLNLSLGSNRHKYKNFQWHKLYLFNKKIKKWKYIFYLDINMHIHFDINDLLDIKPKNKILARADGYPEYTWALNSQFDVNHEIFPQLEKNFNLDITNYFQTGLLFFDTNIVKENTLDEIIFLVEKYPISITNEQGILNLYFIFLYDKYEELVKTLNGQITYFYWLIDNKDVKITKATTTRNK